MTAAVAKAAGEFTITLDGTEYPVVFEGAREPAWTVTVNRRSFTVKLTEDGTVLVDGIAYDVTLDGETVRADDGAHTMEVSGLSVGRGAPIAAAASARSAEAGAEAGVITAIMPGQVTRVLVEEGQRVEEGEAICVLEAMKMENELRADHDGVVKAVHVRAGDDVEKDQVLVEIE